MKKNKKLINSLLLVTCASSVHSSPLWAACSLDQLIAAFATYNDVGGLSTEVPVCGQTVTVSTTNPGGIGALNALTTQELLDAQGNLPLQGDLAISVDGRPLVAANSVVSKADLDRFIRALGIETEQRIKEQLSSTSMSSTSSSNKVNDIIYHSVISPSLVTRSQQKQEQARPLQRLIVSYADLKYERAEFTDTNNKGNIGGFTASGSYDFSKSFSVGAVIPYDYLSFNTFDAHRTGIILYGKHTLSLPGHLQLSNAINGNYLYTATQLRRAGSDDLNTFGGGFSSRLQFDNNGDFIPSAAFSYQYNEDDLNIRDNHQHLIKIGPSFGYRVLDNATVQLSGAWNKDITPYTQTPDDTEFYDVGVESAWVIADTWQLRGGYRKMLGLNHFDSDSFYLGSSIKF